MNAFLCLSCIYNSGFKGLGNLPCGFSFCAHPNPIPDIKTHPVLKTEKCPHCGQAIKQQPTDGGEGDFMNKQQQFDCIKALPRVKSDTYKKRKWAKALQTHCDTQAIEHGDKNGDYVCGYMKYCDYCMDSGAANACVNAIKALAKERGKEIDYNNYDFEKIITEVEYE